MRPQPSTSNLGYSIRPCRYRYRSLEIAVSKTVRMYWCIAGLLFTLFAPPAVAQADKAGWDVNAPSGDWQTIDIDTQETTWSNVTVSPDGRTIVFDMLGDLYSLPIEGGDATALTSDIAWNFQPSFSPDGSKIAFISDRGGADNLWVMNADGSEPRQVSQERYDLVHNPAWSPDGRYLAAKKSFMGSRSIAGGEIWMFLAAGEGEGLQLTERPFGDEDQKNQADPAFSHDGRYVYFSQDTTPGRVWEYGKDATGQIFVIQRYDRQDGEIDTFVSGPGGAVRPVPSPDGRYLAFVKRLVDLKSALYLKDLRSGLETPIFDDFERDLQETSGTEGNAPAFSWLPDASAIVFWSGGKLHRIDVGTREVSPIPLRVTTTRKVQKVLRNPVDVAADRFRVRMPRWPVVSPDGNTVVFAALGVLWKRDLPNGVARRLTDSEGVFESWPSFSADGKQVVYVTWSDSEQGQVRVATLRNGRSRAVTSEKGNYVEPAFSPDGEEIVFRRIGGGYLLSPLWSLNPGIYLVSEDGKDFRQISEEGRTPRFSADGERIWYVDGGGSGLQLKSMDRLGLDVRTHVEGKKMVAMAPSPDGRWLAFIEEHNVYAVPLVETGKVTQLSASTSALPVRQLSARAGDFLAWRTSDTVTWSRGPVLYDSRLDEAFALLRLTRTGPARRTWALISVSRSPGITAKPPWRLSVARVVTMRDAWGGTAGSHRGWRRGGKGQPDPGRRPA